MKILVVDDEKGIRESLRWSLEDEGFEVLLAENGYKALELLKGTSVDVVVLDLLLPDIDGLDVLRKIKKHYPEIPVIVMSGHGTIETAVKSIKLGAYNFLEKPISLDELMVDIENAVKMEKLYREKEAFWGSFAEEELVGKSEAIGKLKEDIEKVAKSDASVLIVGENGTGKGLVARLIHRKSPRRDGPFVEIQCSLVPEEFLELELFGCEVEASKDGRAKRGKIELADGGTLFLDEVGDLNEKAQSKLARVIEDKVIERLGGTRKIGVDVRIVASTRKDLRKEVEEGRFREDLFYRLNVVELRIPPLRERREDIKPLLEHFSRRFSKKYGKKLEFPQEALEVLESYHWPGNVRELRNLVERLFILQDEEVVGRDRLMSLLDLRGDESDPFSKEKLKDALRSFEREFILRKLRENRGNIAKTAKSIGIGRRNLYYRIKNLGIDLEGLRE